MKLCLRLLLLFLLGLSSQANEAAALSESELAEKQLIENLRSEKGVRISDITPSLKPYLSTYKQIDKTPRSYNEIKNYYQKFLNALKTQYPEGTFSLSYEFLQPFSGEVTSGAPDTHLLPAALIVPESTFLSDAVSFQKLEIEFSGRVIPGLQISGATNPALYKILEMQHLKGPFYIAYCPDVNARILGFRSGQVMMDLSTNVATADLFDYNGLHNWNEHQRYQQNDQISKAISLTNFSHSLGSLYAISVHPDFSLQIVDARAGTRITFFLWKSEGYSGKGAKYVPRRTVPDFVYRINLKAAT